jgi:riboflavin kinase/FMN adenylyltransferase
MELIRGLHNLRPRHIGSALTIGNFDGVHRGHQVILQQLKAAATRLAVPDTVVIFEPQPQEFFQRQQAPARIMHWRDKVDALAAAGVARVLCVSFDEHFRDLTAQAFIEKVLVAGLGCRHLVIGDDFRFGCDRRGDFALLQQAGAAYQFEVTPTQTVTHEQERVSSTWVRNALLQADFNTAQALLGRPFFVSGHVVHGDKLGRTLGVPTANIYPRRLVNPLRGIYAVSVDGLGSKPVYGVSSVGTRPTVNGLDDRIETYLFDFNEDIYGRRIRVNFFHKIRDELKFSSLDELKAVMANDIRLAQDFFELTVR